MVYVNKVVTWLLSPIGMLFLGFFAATLLGRVKGPFAPLAKKARRILVILALLFFWVLGCNFTTRLIGVPLEGEEYPPIERRDLGGVDAVVLLGGGMGCHKTCGRPEMFMSADRVWEAARVWKAHRSPRMKIVLSGADVEQSTMPLLRDMNISTDDILLFPDARNTEEEARMISKAGVRRVCLVTSAWHMPRARMLFERAGLEVVPAPTDYEMNCVAELPIGVGDFFPAADALLRNSLAVKEWIARVLYAIRG